MEDLRNCIECFRRVGESSKFYCDTRFGIIIDESTLYPPYRNRTTFSVFPVSKYLGSNRTDDIFHVTIVSVGVTHTIPVFFHPADNTFICRDYDPSVIIPNILADPKHSDFLQSKLHPMYKFGYVADYSTAPRDPDWYKRYLPRNMMSDERMKIRDSLDMDIIYEDDMQKPGIQTISGPPLHVVQKPDSRVSVLTERPKVPLEELSEPDLRKLFVDKTQELHAKLNHLKSLDQNLIDKLDPKDKQLISEIDQHAAELIAKHPDYESKKQIYKKVILSEMAKLGVEPKPMVRIPIGIVEVGRGNVEVGRGNVEVGRGNVEVGRGNVEIKTMTQSDRLAVVPKNPAGFTLEVAKALGYDPKDFLNDKQIEQLLTGRPAESEDDVKHDAAYHAANTRKLAIQRPSNPEVKRLQSEVDASIERMRQLQAARQMHEYHREEHRQLLRETRRTSPHPLDGTLDFNPDFSRAFTPGFAGSIPPKPDVTDNIEWVINHATPAPVHTGRVQEPDTDTSDGCSCTADGECAAHDVNRDYDPAKDPDLADEMIDMFGDVSAQIDEPKETILEPEDEDKPSNCVCERPDVISAECNAHDSIIRRPPRKLTHVPRMSYEEAMDVMQKERYAQQQMRTYDLARASIQESSDFAQMLDSDPRMSAYNQRIRKELEELEEAKKQSLESLVKQIEATSGNRFPSILTGEPILDLPTTDVPKLPAREDNL